MGVEAGMERREGHPGHSLECFEMRRTRTINAPDACQVALSWSSYERARARNARTTGGQWYRYQHNNML